jgi:hypothetical protein
MTNIHKLKTSIAMYVQDVKIDDDERLIIKNRDDSIFNIKINEMLIIDETFHVFNMNKETFNYLFKEV